MSRPLLVTPAASKLITAAIGLNMTEETPKKAGVGAWTDADKVIVPQIEHTLFRAPNNLTLTRPRLVWLTFIHHRHVRRQDRLEIS